MRAPDTYRTSEVRGWNVQERRKHPTRGFIYWQPARPEPCPHIGFSTRVRTAWRVFTGELDALDWNDRENYLDADAVRVALRDVTDFADRQICRHEETYRGGVLWEICSQCGEKWADDEGGKPEFIEPPEITRARTILAKTQEEE